VLNAAQPPLISPVCLAQLAVIPPISPERKVEGNSMRKEKTKSKVWGIFLGGKVKKEKPKEEEVVITPVEDVKARASGVLPFTIIPDR